MHDSEACSGPRNVDSRSRSDPTPLGTMSKWLLMSCLSLMVAVRGAEPPEGASTVPDLADLASLSLDELVRTKVDTVYAASRHVESVLEAPSTVTVLRREDFQHFGYRTLADALRGVRGFYVTGDRAYSYVGLRGLNRPGDYGGGVLVMVDGHRLNDPVADQAFNGGEMPLDPDLIERVEVVRGPGSTMYGNNALFSVINVVTRRGREVGLEASASAASLDTYAGRFSAGHQFTNGVEVLVSGSYLQSQGHERLFYPEFSSINNGWSEGLDGEERGSAFLSVAYGDLQLRGGYGRRQKDLPAAPYGSLFNVGPNHVADERAWGELSYRTDPDQEWQVEASLYYDHFNYDALGPYDGEELGLPGSTLLSWDLIRARWWGGGVQVGRELLPDHRLSLGVEGRHNPQVDQDVYYIDPPVTLTEAHGDGYNAGVYLQDDWTIRTNLLVGAGLRYDRYSSFGDTLNPRASIIYSPWATTTFKALYGQAYRAPNAYETDYAGLGYLPNPTLGPETFRSTEFVVEQRITGPWRCTALFFWNQMDDQIIQFDQSADPSVGGWIFRNGGGAEILGAELGVEGRWAHGLRLRAGYTYADARDDETGARLSNSPEHLVQFNLAVPLYRENVFAGLEVLGMSRRKAAVSEEMAPGFWIANLTLFSRELVRGLEASASVYNLFDNRYFDPVSPDFTQSFLESDGRMFRVKLTYRY